MQQCEEQLQPHEFVRISAVNGADLNAEQLTRHYNAELNLQNYHKVLGPGEIGCYLSHRKVWQYIVEQQLSYAIVLEDDFKLVGSIDAVVSSIDGLALDWDVIKLAEKTLKRKATNKQTAGDFQLVTFNKIPSRTCAQAISYAGAKKLLRASERFGRPVDIDMQYWWESSIQVFGLRPYPFALDDTPTSDIDKISKRKAAPTRRLAKIRQQIAFYLNNRRALKGAGKANLTALESDLRKE